MTTAAPSKYYIGSLDLAPLRFELPEALHADAPPEARGLARDEVRLMVTHRGDDRVVHTQFRDLPRFLTEGDVVVINTSGTLNAALHATRADGTAVEVHLSTHLPADLWLVELREPWQGSTRPLLQAQAGETLALPAGGSLQLLTPYGDSRTQRDLGTRLWVATLLLPEPLHPYLARHGFPIRYHYIKQTWPLEYYQTVYATEMGSAEMPSAGRAFTPSLITQLVAQGVAVVPLLLHTGVASLETHEPPYEEWYRVPLATARAVNRAHADGTRVVAVGTTVVRALETVADERGTTHPGEGWTRLVITPARGVRAVDGLLTGFHEPEATHLAMLHALAGSEQLGHWYDEAIRQRYLWHEFGDLHLILP
jgi:S-adenosylmethionine:tRNA ribosyltransferase-isomerase